MKRGWCPSLYEPMAASDGLLLRVKPFGGQLSADAAMLLAAAATRFGNGRIQLTNRANLQFRGFTAESAGAFADVAGGLGLAETRPGAERRRNVIVSPLAGRDRLVHPATLDVARAMEALLMQTDDFSVLSAKFGLVIDGGGPVSVLGAPGDIIIVLRGEVALVSLDGRKAAIVPPCDLVAVIRQMIGAFIRQGPPSRMRDADQRRVLDAAGLTATETLPSETSLSRMGPASFGFCVGVAFGQMDATAMQALATASGADGLFITPWRSVLLRHPAPVLSHPGLITRPDDARLSMAACIGMQGCDRGSVDSLADAATLAQSGQLSPAFVHVSGCAKGCAHRAIAAYTVVGEAGRYNLVRNGRADSEPLLRGLSLSDLLAHMALEDLT